MCTRSHTYVNPIPCEHLEDYKRRHGLTGYISLQNFFKTSPSGRTSIKCNEREAPRCFSCKGYQGRLYVCLICLSISCSIHTRNHTKAQDNHNIYVDIDRSELYCSLCRDQLYDSDFDNIIVSHNRVLFDDSSRSSKRRKMCSKSQLGIKISRSWISRMNRGAKSCYPLGLRGLNNLGSTCYVNSVLQALIHSPPFRNYFLNDQHERETCKLKLPPGLGSHSCLICAINDTFSAMYSGDHTPYSPSSFLYSWWLSSEEFATYEQLDAHDFFMALLNGIHEKEDSSLISKDIEDCRCIAHKVFHGKQRSDVMCMTCGYISTTYQDCLSISLSLEKDCSLKDKKTAVSTLYGCLGLYTKPENLDSDVKRYCQQCKAGRDSSIQCSFSKPPLVLCFHIKRFEHSQVNGVGRKTDVYLEFPFSLDITPYLSSSIIRKKFGNRIVSFECSDSDVSSEFEIFAVVTHSGNLHSGHYMTYLRLRNEWYKCDDPWILKVDEETVRASECYLIFYAQKMLYFQGECDLICNRTCPMGPVATDFHSGDNK